MVKTVLGILAAALLASAANGADFVLGGKPQQAFVLAGTPPEAFKPQKQSVAGKEAVAPLVIKKSFKTYAQATIEAKKSGRVVVVFVGVGARQVGDLEVAVTDPVGSLPANTVWVAKVKDNGDVEGYELKGAATDAEIIATAALFPAKTVTSQETVITSPGLGFYYNGPLVSGGVCVGGNCPRR